MVPLATASDGGGSTRIPAGFSGLVGMKPSYGRIPHPTADPSQTAVFGVEVTTVADAARHLDVTAGPDDRDRVTLPPPGVRYEDAIEGLDVSDLRIGWSLDLGFAVVDPEVAELTRAAAQDLADAAGTDLVDVDVRLTDPVRTWLTAGAVTLWLEIQEHEHYPGRLHELTPFVRMALEAGYDTPIRSMVPSLRRRLQLDEDCARIFDEVDVLLTPTTAVPAFVAEGPSPTTIAGVDLVEAVGPLAAGAMSVPFTMLANLCWNPACSVPAGLAADGLPVGLQIMGRRHEDDRVLRLARLLEQSRPWPRHAPMGRGLTWVGDDASAVAAQEGLDLGDQRVGPGVLDGRLVPGALELGHVLGTLLVVGQRLVDLGLVVGGGLGQVVGVDGDAQQVGHAGHQGEGRLGRRRAGHVGGHGRPQRGRAHVAGQELVVEDADDAGGALVAGRGEGELLGHRVLVGGAVDRDRAGVGHVGQQRSEGHHQIDAQHVGHGG